MEKFSYVKLALRPCYEVAHVRTDRLAGTIGADRQSSVFAQRGKFDLIDGSLAEPGGCSWSIRGRLQFAVAWSR
jgi:hypothetical protein